MTCSSPGDPVPSERDLLLSASPSPHDRGQGSHGPQVNEASVYQGRGRGTFVAILSGSRPPMMGGFRQ
jgi:hypothetical protein